MSVTDLNTRIEESDTRETFDSHGESKASRSAPADRQASDGHLGSKVRTKELPDPAATGGTTGAFDGDDDSPHEYDSRLARLVHDDLGTDSRPCPHNGCHGTLTVEERQVKGDGPSPHEADTGECETYLVALCWNCRMTPDGRLLTQATRSLDTGDPYDSTQPRYGASVRRRGTRHDHPWADRERARYGGSGKVRLAGGFASAWPDETTRVSDEFLPPKR